MQIFAYILALIVGFAFGDGPINGTCSEWGIWKPEPHFWYLRGNCTANNGTSACNYINLGLCYGVDDYGMLQPETLSFGVEDCKHCVIDGLHLTCDCLDKHGQFHTSERSFDEAIATTDGIFSCFNQTGWNCNA
ncbi:hypothetical protein PG993_008530 [Apiospora rasikravindrae]|uniref:Cyanovirin-N domain-containing protein n=1 Tax=Apiospora rasikravindrae TaxID=990691 RepID=A0ABR1T0L9_9PEZI